MNNTGNVRLKTLIVVLCALISCDGGHTPSGGQLYGQNNAIWSESIYFRGYRPSTGETLTDQHLENYARKLRKYNIRYAYIFSGPYDTTGHLPDYAFSETAVRSVEVIKSYNPDVVILPWIGGVQNRTVFLGDTIWVKNALNDTKKLIQRLNVPGVHVDFEYILPGDPYLDMTIKKEKPGDRESYGDNVNSFHKKLREILPNAFISSVVVSTSSGTKPWKRKTTMSELRTLSQYIDQLSFLFYDTQLNDNSEFKANCIELVRDIRNLKATQTSQGVQYLVAIGTFVNAPQLHKYRNLQIESIANTLTTIRHAIANTPAHTAHEVVDGIALYCDWETELKEYEEFYQYWVDN